MEEVVRWLIKPPAAMPVPVGLEVEGVATGALVQEVVKGVGRPATPASELVLGDVRPEPPGIIRGEGVAHCKTEGRGGGVPGVDGQGVAGLGVCVRAHGLLPEGVIVAVRGFGDCVLMHKGGVGAGTGRGSPFGGPPREGTLPSNRLAVRRRLNPVEGGAGGDVAGREGFEPGRGVRGAGEVGRGPHRSEADGGVAVDKGREGGVKEESLTLVGETPGVGNRCDGREAAAKEVNV